MALKGWISVHRKMTEWEWYGDSNVFRLFIHLLLLANHKDNSWRGITVPAGSLITGRKSLSADLNLSEQQIRTALKKLKSTSEITTQITNEYSMISITNWDNYQGSNQPDNQRATSEQPTDNQRITTNNNENNAKNEKKIGFNDFYTLYPKKERKKDTKAKWDRLPLEDQQKAIDGIASFTRGKETKFICAPIVYLNGERWEDESTPNQATKTDSQHRTYEIL